MKTKKNNSRPCRSFMPQVLKPIKTLHFRGDGAQYIGAQEPSWPAIEIQELWTKDQHEKHLGEAFNWYTLTQDDKHGHDLAVAALGLSGHFPELIVALKNSKLSLSHTVAWLIRMIYNGMKPTFHEKRFIVKAIRDCVNNQKESATSTGKIAKPNIQDYISAKVRRVKAEIDDHFDDFIRSGYTYAGLAIEETNQKKPLSIVAEILNEPEFSIPGNRAKDLADYCHQYLDEYNAVLAGKNEQLTEAYAPVSKKNLKAAIAFWEQAILDINTFGQHKQSIRKTRKRKQKPPAQIVGKLKYLREFPELKLKSVDPTQILKSSEIWIYNTRLRKLGHYVAAGSSTLDVKGTRILNLDTVKSVQKTLRKPAEQLKQFENYGKPGAIKWFNQIKAVATRLRPAINGDSILLRSVK